MERTRNRTVVLLLVALLIAGAVWLAMPANDPAVGGVDGASGTHVDASAILVAAPHDPSRRAPREVAPRHDDAGATPNAAREAAPVDGRASLRVVLRGLHPDVPWTMPLHLEFVGLQDTGGAVHSDDVVPDADGRAQFVLPAWWKRCRHGRITAENDRYHSPGHQWMSTPEVAADVVIDVQVLAEMTGRAVDARGRPANANVTAFQIDRAGRYVPARTIAVDDQGAWRLQVPPNEPLLLVAQPTGYSPHGIRFSSWRDRPAPPPPTVGLLPTSRRASCPAGSVVTVPDLVLPDALALRCRVGWLPDGAPIPGADVMLVPREGDPLRIPDGSRVHRRDDGRLATSASARTDREGIAVLPMLAGATADVRLVGLAGSFLAAPNVTLPVTGDTIEFGIPRPVTLRALRNGMPASDVSFESRLGGPSKPESARFVPNGSAQFVPNAPLQVRAVLWTCRSRWIELTTAMAGSTIDLEMEEGRHEVTVVLDGISVGAAVRLVWRASDGRAGVEQQFAEPKRKSLQLFLDPGRYWLRAESPGGGTVSTAEQEFVVDGAPATVTLIARHGGSIVVHAKDAFGNFVPGTCRVRNADGEDLTGTFAVTRFPDDPVRGEPGELSIGGPNRLERALPPGDYELFFEFSGFGARHERITVRDGEVVHVRIRP